MSNPMPKGRRAPMMGMKSGATRKMNESPLHASRAETGGRSYSDFTSRIKMDLIHIFPGPFAKASHFAP